MAAITLDLTPELEVLLKEKAAARGLSPEGYLLTLIEAIAHPPQSRARSGLALPFLRKKQPASSKQDIDDPDVLVGQAAQDMRERLLAYKEQAIEAVTLMNLLQRANEEQRRLAVETELQALSALTDGNREQAKRLFQEKVVLERHLESLCRELATATEDAEAKTQVFHEEEEQVKARTARAYAVAYKAYQKAILTPQLVEKLIPRLHTAPEWNAAFDQWAQQKSRKETTEAVEELHVDFPGEAVEGIKTTMKEWAKEARKKDMDNRDFDL
jgi:phage shock protein A